MSEVPPTIQRSYRIRVYPTAAQRARLARWFGAARWVWNHALECRSKAYRRRGESVTNDCIGFDRRTCPVGHRLLL